MLLSAAPAWAHVTVDAPGATSGGGDQLITFRVPTESDTASTTGLKVQLPTDTPIASVLVQPIPGWTFTETTVKLSKPIVTDDGDVRPCRRRPEQHEPDGSGGNYGGAAHERTHGQPFDQCNTMVAVATVVSNSDVVTLSVITQVPAAGSSTELAE